MTTTDTPDPLVLRGADGLLAAVPELLGFHPRDSLVQVSLSGSPATLGPVGRVDLDPPDGISREDYTDGVTASLVQVARQHADRVVLVWYRSLPGRRPALVTAHLHELAAAGIPVGDVVSVCGRRFRSERTPGRVHRPGISPESAARPLPGFDHPDVLQLRAWSVLRGRTVLPDREALRQSIAGPVDPNAHRVAVAAFERYGRTPAPGPDDYAAELDLALAECAERGTLSPARVAAVVHGTSHPDLCTYLITRAVGERDQPWVALLAACARATPQANAGDLCAVLAVVAYCHGEGATAQVAVDRALACPTGHRLARLLIEVMAAGIHPQQIAASFLGRPPAPGRE